MRTAHDVGASRIYELVLNTDPYQAYLLEGNSWVAQLLVIANVYGHCWSFANNGHLSSVDRKYLHRARAGAQRIEDHARRHGRVAVDDFIDAVQAVAIHAPSRLVCRADPTPPPPPDPGPYSDLFPDETAAALDGHRAAVEAWHSRTPRQPEADLLGFVLEHGSHLTDWEREIISVLREEAAYFEPQRRTKIANGGFACWVHTQIVQAMDLGTDEFLEFNRLNAEIGQPHPHQVNPYNAGLELWREVERIHDAPTDEEAVRYAGTGRLGGHERVLERGPCIWRRFVAAGTARCRRGTRAGPARRWPR